MKLRYDLNQAIMAAEFISKNNPHLNKTSTEILTLMLHMARRGACDKDEWLATGGFTIMLTEDIEGEFDVDFLVDPSVASDDFRWTTEEFSV